MMKERLFCVVEGGRLRTAQGIYCQLSAGMLRVTHVRVAGM